MTVDELSAMIDECAGESVLHEAYAADPEQTRATLESSWTTGMQGRTLTRLFTTFLWDVLWSGMVIRRCKQVGSNNRPYPIFKLLSSVSGSPDCSAVRSWCSTKC